MANRGEKEVNIKCQFQTAGDKFIELYIKSNATNMQIVKMSILCKAVKL